MLFEFVILLVLILLIVSNVLLTRRIPDKRTMKMIEKTNFISSRALTATQIYIDSQRDIDKLLREFDVKIDDLSKFVNEHTTGVVRQLEQFSSVAKSDMLSARREELRRLKELKVALERLMGVALTSRQPPAPNDILALENIEKRIEELEKIFGQTWV